MNYYLLALFLLTQRQGTLDCLGRLSEHKENLVRIVEEILKHAEILKSLGGLYRSL